MDTNATVIPISPADLEILIRRVVREELGRLVRKPMSHILDDLEQEGSEDLAQDEILLKEALATLQQYSTQPDAWINWKEFELELDRAEAAGELPD
jgi:hypothetical protein